MQCLFFRLISLTSKHWVEECGPHGYLGRRLHTGALAGPKDCLCIVGQRRVCVPPVLAVCVNTREDKRLGKDRKLLSFYIGEKPLRYLLKICYNTVYQLAFNTPGKDPFEASSLNRILEIRKRL